MTAQTNTALAPPAAWDRRGLPGWAYHSAAMLELERREIFLTHWQIAGHESEVVAPGAWTSFDLLGERAVIMRGQDGVLRAFHNLCRHRGARVVDGASGQCKGSIVCPFHGWVYNLDGTLRGVARPDSFSGMDRGAFGLKPIEMELFHGFILIRFQPGPQPRAAEWLGPYDGDFTAYRAARLMPDESAPFAMALPVNWKSVRDVDNEGYHVAMAHPALQDLYGRTYRDVAYPGGLSFSTGQFGDAPGRRWSVRRYLSVAPEQAWLPPHLRRSWTYYGLFPNAVIAFTPESAQYYQELPLGVGTTLLRGRSYRHAEESRGTRAARYLAKRIDRETSAEDQQLSVWSNESMKSSAFDGFHLSDLEYGLRCHHDMLRRFLPVLNDAEGPSEGRMAARNSALLAQRPA